MAYVVDVPLVLARDEDGTDVYLYRDAVVPSSVPQAEVDRLAKEKFISELVPLVELVEPVKPVVKKS